MLNAPANSASCFESTILLAAVHFESRSNDALPVCLCPPWEENPYRLVSLWDMVAISTADIILALDQLRMLVEILEDPARTIAEQNTIQRFIKNVPLLQGMAERCALTSSVMQARRVMALWSSRTSKPKEIAEHIVDLILRFKDDLYSRMFYCLEAK